MLEEKHGKAAAEQVVLFWVLTAADVLLSMAELLCEPHRKLLSF